MRGPVFACLSAALALAAGVALANGTAQPDSVSFFADATAPGDFAMNATFGFLFSDDAGASWEWTCHEAVIGDAAFTPGSWRSPTGAFYVTTPLLLGNDPSLTLWRSDHRGCNWVGNESLRNESVRALAFRPGDDTTVLAIGSRTGGIAAAWRSTDAGITFGAPLLEVPEHVFNTVHYAPSDPQRLYVAAIKQTVPQDSTLYRSDDGGGNWTPIPFTQFDQPPIRVLAVDPLNADVIWLRNDSAIDRVFRSTNGGLAFSLVHSIDTDVVGMALTDAGATQWLAVSRADGLLHATTASPAFLPVPGSPIARCVEAEGDAVYVCAHPYEDPYSAAVTFDGGATFDTAMTFQRISGPLTGCPADSSHVTICQPLWPQVRLNLGLDATTPTPSPTPTPGNPGDRDPGCSCSLARQDGDPFAGCTYLLGAAAIALAIRRRFAL
jgi:hypothetical protein